MNHAGILPLTQPPEQAQYLQAFDKIRPLLIILTH